MNYSNKTIICFSLVIHIVALLPFSLLACSCAYQPMGIQKILEYDCVFKGMIISKEVIDTNYSFESGRSSINEHGHRSMELNYFKYTFKIEVPIKGTFDDNKMHVYSITQSSACGVDYSIGDELIIFSYKKQNKFFTSLCSDNKNTSDVDQNYWSIIDQFIYCQDYREWKNIDKVREAKGRVINGQAIGEWKYYHSNGALKAIGQFINGIKHGEWKYYEAHGFLLNNGTINTLRSIVIYDNGKVVSSKNIRD